MSKQIAVLDTPNYRYIISPLKPGNVCTPQDIFKAIKNSTQLKWAEIAEFAGLKNANRAFRVAYLNNKVTEDMTKVQEYTVIDSGAGCAYFYDKDHKPAQVVAPHVGPEIVSGETGQTVTASVPTIFATRVVVSDALDRRLKVTFTPTNGYTSTPTDHYIYAAGTERVFTGGVKSINRLLKEIKFVGTSAGAASVVIKVDDMAGEATSTASVTVNLTVEDAVVPSVPTLTVPESVSGTVSEYTPISTITTADTDGKVLAVRVSAFNCQVYGFKNWLEVLHPQHAHSTFGEPEFVNADLAGLKVMPLNTDPASIGVELKCGSTYVLKYITVTGTAASDTEDSKNEAETVSVQTTAAAQPKVVQAQATTTEEKKADTKATATKTTAKKTTAAKQTKTEATVEPAASEAAK